MRLSRPCYDKPHRCPGWAGGGMKYPKGDSRCDNGSIRTRVPEAPFEGVVDYPSQFEHPAVARWRFGHCDTCGVVTWPWVTRHLDPTHWLSGLRSAIRRLRWAWMDR